VGTRKTYQKMLGGGDPAGSRCGSVVKEQGGIETGDPETVLRTSLAGNPSAGQVVPGVEAA
jgi:hypothetical protein